MSLRGAELPSDEPLVLIVSACRLEQLDRIFNQGTDEKLALAESHEAEKHALQLTHEHEVERLETQFHDHVLELEAKYNVMEVTCLAELEQLRASSAAQLAEASAKAARALADLTESAQRERDALDLSLRAELQSLTMSSDAKLAALEATSRAEYEELQHSSSEEIRSLREASASHFAEATDGLRKQLEELQQSRIDELAALRSEHENEKSRLNVEHARELAALKSELDATTTKLSADIQELVQQHAQEREAAKSTSDQTIESLISTHTKQLDGLRAAAAAELAQTIEQLTQASDVRAAETARLRNDASAAQTALVDRYESELTLQRDESKRERDLLTLSYETKIDALKRSSLETLERAAKAHDTSVTQLRDAHSAKTLQLEALAREQEKKFAETLLTQSLELERQQNEISSLESKLEALGRTHRSFVDASQQLVARSEMDGCEREARMLLVQQELCEQLAALEQTRWELRAAGEDQRTKANTILELTFVVKSRDDEVERLRAALLDSVKSANQKTEILELTAETLSSKAKELEDTRAALRKESGRLSRVEESMHQKDEILEDTELKVESMRLSMENLRLEMKRLQMDMKLQLEHSEGEMELKNGEIGRLHAAQSELRSKSEFQQQSLARLEESLAQTQKQADDAQRRIHLLRLEAAQSADEAKKVSDALLERDEELLVLAKDKHSAVYDKQRAQIQLTHLAQVVAGLHEKSECQLMFCEEVQTRFLTVLAESSAEKDERLRAEKHLLVLELSATKERVRHLEGVEARLADSKRENETQRTQVQSLSQELEAAVAASKEFEKTVELARRQIDELTTTRAENEHSLACTHDKLRFEGEVASASIAALTATLNELSERNAVLMEEREMMTNDHMRMKSDLAMMTSDHVTLTNEHEALTKEHEVLMSECKQQRDRVSALARQNEELTKALSGEKLEMTRSIERRVGDLEDAKLQLETQLSDAAAKLQTAELTIERLEQALQNETTSHLNDIKKSEQELMLRRKEIANLECDFGVRLNARADQATEETRDAMKERLETELREQQLAEPRREQLEDTNAVIDEQAGIANDEVQLEDTKSRLASCEAQLVQLQHRLAQTEQELVESSQLVADCRQELGLVPTSSSRSAGTPRSEILDCIRELMEVLQRFEGFQPGSSASHAMASPPGTATGLPCPSIHEQVTAVLSFLDELHLMADFAQSILDEESDVTASTGSQSNTSSTESIGSARPMLTRTPTPSSEPTMESGDGEEEADALQIEVPLPLPLDELERELQQHDDMHQVAFDDSEDSRMFFTADDVAVSGDVPAAPSAAPLAESLVDISLVMSDHHRVLSEAAHWVKKTARLRRRRSSSSSRLRPPADLGSEICRLVREHCALLSLAKKLFQLKDPRHDLWSLLECLAVLQRLTSRLSVFQDDLGAARANSVSSESLSSLNSSVNTSSQDSLLPSLSVFACLEDIARHLQDHDFFLQQMRDNRDKQRLTGSVTNVELLTQEITGQLELVAHAQSMLGMQNPMLELPKLLQSVHELVAMTERLDPWHSTMVAEGGDQAVSGDDAAHQEAPNGVEEVASSDHEVSDKRSEDDDTGSSPQGVDAYVSAFGRIKNDLAGYTALVSWLRGVLPFAHPIDSIDDVKDRVQEVLAQLECFANTSVEMRDELALLRAERVSALEQQAIEDTYLASHGVNAETTSLARGVYASRLELFKRLVEERQRLRVAAAGEGVRDGEASAENDTQRPPIHEQLVAAVSRPSAWEEDIVNERSVLEELGLLASSCRREVADASTTEGGSSGVIDATANLPAAAAAAAPVSLADRVPLYKRLAELERLVRTDREALSLEKTFLRDNQLEFDDAEPAASRLKVYKTLIDGQNALIEEKMEREVELGNERGFLDSHGIASTTSRMDVVQSFVKLREQLAERDEADAMERAFLKSNGLWSVEQPEDDDRMDAQEQFGVRIQVFSEYLEARAAETHAKQQREAALAAERAYLLESTSLDASLLDGVQAPQYSRLHVFEQLLSAHSEAEAELKSDSLTEQEDAFLRSVGFAPPLEASSALDVRTKVYDELLRRVRDRDETISWLERTREKQESALMAWNEIPLVRASEFARLESELIDAVATRDELLTRLRERFAMDHAAEAERHVSEVQRLERAHDDKLADAAAASKKELAMALEKQAKQLEFYVLVRRTEESLVGGGSTSATALSPAQARALLLDKVTKRDTSVISMIYRSIRLATDILNTFAFTRGGGGGNSSSASSEIPVEVTQAVLDCVKELKALKEYLIESLEQLTRGDDVFPSQPPPFLKPNVDAAIAAGDKEAAIDFALCSHREFMAFANRALLTRQEAADAKLVELLGKLKAIASGDTDATAAFTLTENTVMELEMERVREREARDNADCKLQLNDEYYRRLLDERKQVEAALSNALAELRDECRTLRAKIDSLEQERYAQPPPGSSSSMYGLSPRATPMTPSYGLGFGSGMAMAPMRPEKPREVGPSNRTKGGAGSVHKERFVSDLEKETGQRRSANTWRRHDGVDANPSSSQLEKEFRATDAGRDRSGLDSAGGNTSGSATGAHVQEQELWHQGVRMVQHISFFVTVFFVPKQTMFRVELFNSDTEQQQTVYVTRSEMEAFVAESKRAAKAGLSSLDDPARRAEITDVLFERVRVYGEGSSNVLLGFE